jgi:hypothetical protein
MDKRVKRHNIRVGGIGETYHQYVRAEDHDAVVYLLEEDLRKARAQLREYVRRHEDEWGADPRDRPKELVEALGPPDSAGASPE